MNSIHILSVGHGNCALVDVESGLVVVDAPRRTRLLDYLLARGITSLAALLISHADQDHLAGCLLLLQNPEFTVNEVYVNPEQGRQTDLWDDFKIALQEAFRRGTRVHPSLNAQDPGSLSLGRTKIEIAAPLPVPVLAGPGGKVGSTTYSSNSLSAVCRVIHDGVSRILLPGDLDDVGLRDLAEVGAKLDADVLVFPHHGGRPGNANVVEFVRELWSVAPASCVVYSIGSRPTNPRPEVMAALREVAGQVYVACTGLSVHCASAGAQRQVHCAGDIVIDLDTGLWVQPSKPDHRAFIASSVVNPLCGPFRAPES